MYNGNAKIHFFSDIMADMQKKIHRMHGITDLSLNILLKEREKSCLLRAVLILFRKYFRYYFCKIKKKCKFANPLLAPVFA
jgi:hypothetical protein